MYILPVYFAKRCLSHPKNNEIQQTNHMKQIIENWISYGVNIQSYVSSIVFLYHIHFSELRKNIFQPCSANINLFQAMYASFNPSPTEQQIKPLLLLCTMKICSISLQHMSYYLMSLDLLYSIIIQVSSLWLKCIDFFLFIFSD